MDYILWIIFFKSHYYKCECFILKNKFNFSIDAVPVNKNTNLKILTKILKITEIRF
jgi:hypothetical protein